MLWRGSEMTRQQRQARQAQVEHPRLYALQQHGPIRLLGSLLWTPKAQKVARKAAQAAPRAQAPVTRAYRPFMAASEPRTVVVHIHAGAVVNF